MQFEQIGHYEKAPPASTCGRPLVNIISRTGTHTMYNERIDENGVQWLLRRSARFSRRFQRPKGAEANTSKPWKRTDTSRYKTTDQTSKPPRNHGLESRLRSSIMIRLTLAVWMTHHFDGATILVFVSGGEGASNASIRKIDSFLSQSLRPCI